MSNGNDSWMDMLREWNGNEHIHILLIVVAAVCIYEAVRHFLPVITTKFRPDNRFYMLPWIPLLRLVIILGASALIIPLVIIPTRENVLILLGATALGVGFVLKDYISCLFAGFVLLIERAYKVGDWVRIGDTYGEVVEVGLRIVKLRTAEANDVSIPHSVLWHEPLINATSGQQDLLCVIHFFVHPEPANMQTRKALSDVAGASTYLHKERPIVVVMQNEPFGLHYKIKAYPKDARDQFSFIADVTERGQLALHSIGLRLVATPTAVARHA
jgi:small-conductance mechanosensitive channel